MGEEHNQEVRTEFTIRGDGARSAMSGLAKGAEDLSRRFNSLSNTVAGFGGLAAVGIGAFSFAEVLSNTQKYIGSVKRVHELTGMSAESADGLLDAMKKYGIEAQGAEGILMRLSRHGAQMEMGMAGAARGAGFMGREMRALGVDITHGPQRALETMAVGVKSGRVDAAKLGMAFRIPQGEALKMMHLLEKGPEGVKEAISELAKSGTALTQANLDVYAKIDGAKHRISSGFERMGIIVAKEVLPVIAKLLESVEKELPHWIDMAKDFGHWLNVHLESGLETVVKIGKVLIANAALQKITGGMGVAGGRGVGVMDLPGIAKRTFFAPTGGAAEGGIHAALGSGLGMATAGILKMAGAGGVLAVIGTSVYRILTNADGIADHLSDMFSALSYRISIATGGLSDFSKKDDESGFAWFIHNLPDLVSTGLAQVATYFTSFFDALGDTLRYSLSMKGAKEQALHPFTAMPEHFMEVFNRRIAQAEQSANASFDARLKAKSEEGAKKFAKPETPVERGGTHYDFRGSTFRIEQSFAEGFEPDRVAVAFTEGLAKLGEKRLQSNFQPLYSQH